MIINMTTIAVRTKQYIDETLESLARSDGGHLQVNLILGSYDSSHVEKYRGRYNIVPWDADSEAQSNRDHMRHNCNLNAIRSLRHGDDEMCLCVEDDISFVADWYSRLLVTLEEISEQDFILNLAQRDAAPIGKQYYGVHDGAYLCGAQALFYPTKTFRTAVADYVQAKIMSGMNDHLVGQYAKERAALLGTIPFLVGHIGGVSSFSQPQPPQPEVAPPAGPAPTTQTKPVNALPRGAGEGQGGGAPAPAPPNPQGPPPGRERAELLLALLRSGPAPDAARFGACDLAAFASLATRHGVAPMTYGALRRLGEDPPAEWSRKLKPDWAANLFRCQIARAALVEIGAALHTGEIPVILLSGAPLLFGLDDAQDPLTLDRIDLLVDADGVDRADAVLQKLGLQRTDPPGGALRFIRYQWPERQSLAVRLHTALLEPDDGDFDAREVWAAARPLPEAPPSLRRMTPEHELAQLCVDFDRRVTGAESLLERDDCLNHLVLTRGDKRLLALCRIARVLQRRADELDWNAFVEVARGWGIDARAYATLELSRHALGVGAPAEILRTLGQNRPRRAQRSAS